MKRTSALLKKTGSLALFVCALGLFASATPASAQEGSAPGGSGEIVRGGANAWASSVSVELGSGGATLGATYGRSVASYRDITAQAEGRALDLGLLEPIFALPQCDGTVLPMWDTASLPPKTSVDSFTEGASEGASSEVFWPAMQGTSQSKQVIGNQHAWATEQPWSKASTDIITADLVLLKVLGAETASTTEFRNGVRIAKAESWAKRVSLMGGIIEIKNPHWTAEKRSGAEESENATFTFDSVRLFGITQNADNTAKTFNDFKWAVGQLFSGLGLKFQIPEVQPADVGEGISISPMGFVLTNAPIGKQLLTPLLGSEFMNDVRNKSLDEDCTRAIGWTIIDALDNALGGAGQVVLSVGGATATTDETDYSSPPIAPAPPAEAAEQPADEPEPGDQPANTTSSDFGGDDFGYSDDFGGDDFGGDDFGGDDFGYSDDFDDASFEDDASFGDDFDDGSFDETALPEEFSDSEEPDLEDIAAPGTKSPLTSPSSGPAIAVGLVALLGAAGLSMGDRLVGRRNKRKIA